MKRLCHKKIKFVTLTIKPCFMTSVVVSLILILALLILMVAALWRVYEKAGKPGWACIIPVYNTLVLLEIVKKPWWWIFLLMIPIVNFIIGVWLTNLVSKSFGQGVGFTLGLIFLPFIFWPLLGLGDYKCQN